jgi:hypothetical protein
MARKRVVASEGLEIPKANPGISWDWVLSLLAVVVKPIIKAVTPIIRDALEEALLKLYAKAEATENPWDDWLVGFLLDVLAIERPE